MFYGAIQETKWHFLRTTVYNIAIRKAAKALNATNMKIVSHDLHFF